MRVFFFIWKINTKTQYNFNSAGFGILNVEGYNAYLEWDYHTKRSNVAPLVEVSVRDKPRFLAFVEEAQKNGQEIFIDIESGDRNPFQEVFDNGLFIFMFRVFLPLTSLVCFVLACYKFYLLRSIGRLNFVITYILSVELSVNFIRTIVWPIDPLWNGLIFPNFVERTLIGWTLSWSVSSSIALAFFWLNILHKIRSVEISLFSKNRRHWIIAGFIIVASLLLLIDFITGILINLLYLADTSFITIAGKIPPPFFFFFSFRFCSLLTHF